MIDGWGLVREMVLLGSKWALEFLVGVRNGSGVSDSIAGVESFGLDIKHAKRV